MNATQRTTSTLAPETGVVSAFAQRIARGFATLSPTSFDARRDARLARDERLSKALSDRGWTMLVEPSWGNDSKLTTIVMRGLSVMGVMVREGHCWLGVEQRAYRAKFDDESLDGILFAGASIQDGNPQADLIHLLEAIVPGTRAASVEQTEFECVGGDQDDDSDDYFSRPRLRA